MLTLTLDRIYEDEDLFAAIDARTESLQNLRELGPPDLVYLVKQTKANTNRQVRSSYSHRAVVLSTEGLLS
jgi:hypothetical protein